jgi:hypothetical protein
VQKAEKEGDGFSLTSPTPLTGSIVYALGKGMVKGNGTSLKQELKLDTARSFSDEADGGIVRY